MKNLNSLSCILLCVGALFFACVNSEGVGYTISSAVGYNKLKSYRQSSLYTVNTDPAKKQYTWPIYLADLHGSHYDMGYDYGVLLGKESQSNYNAFLASLIGTSWEDELFIQLGEKAIDWQWDDYLSIQTDETFLQEIAGMGAGGNFIGVRELDKLASRIITIANFPGDLEDFLLILISEYNLTHSVQFQNHLKDYFQRDQTQEFQSSEHVMQLIRTQQYDEVAKIILDNKKNNLQDKEVQGLQCSMFGVWGSRTSDGSLYTARNLDWLKDTGAQQYKTITIWHPSDGGYAHSAFGYAGFIGALTGFSEKGITVHEANLEEAYISFEGFPWVLRLRYVMQNALNLAEAKTIWDNTNNTVGFNHMIGSSADEKSLVMETMYGYTAYFFDNDPREDGAMWKDPTTGDLEQIGFTLEDAVYRTNHGYDPKIRAIYEWNYSPTSWTVERYMFMYNGFSYYEKAGIAITDEQAINITSIVGDKGTHAYECEDNTDGTNVLSVTYHPSQAIAYAAWEDGTDSAWRPAACTVYVKLDFSEWW